MLPPFVLQILPAIAAGVAVTLVICAMDYVRYLSALENLERLRAEVEERRAAAIREFHLREAEGAGLRTAPEVAAPPPRRRSPTPQ